LDGVKSSKLAHLLAGIVESLLLLALVNSGGVTVAAAATECHATTEGDVTSKGVATGNGLVPVSTLVGAVVGILLLAAVVIVIIIVVLQMYWMRRYGSLP
jgi:hypothetical protein